MRTLLSASTAAGLGSSDQESRSPKPAPAFLAMDFLQVAAQRGSKDNLSALQYLLLQAALPGHFKAALGFHLFCGAAAACMLRL